MVRTIIQLTDDQSSQLKRQAKEQGISVAELVRRGVELVLKTGVTDEEIRRRAKAAVGFIKDKPDLSVNHDLYLSDTYGDEYAK